ncbi:type II restriction endonuclease [Caulobacter flavus]|uniref:Type II restriction endonuclease n=1 Tax=Caulobacter flavus TaxID=1679497 RepID=A0A2N5CLU9_9CAUL|nr:type II restriction endonuclease [Caulobacter flavus]AYV48193.1 type II restriction endonuclease [Caulobacter flavus]PLR06882.1 type II restriction endonuclease [Caulobacter flavus]
MSDELTRELLSRWRNDPSGAYQSWFLWEDRLKNFRSIRRGVQQVAAEIEAERFGVTYRGSSLETVVHSIAEQRQVFKGADHAFLWKPKLRIPDIYEHPGNQRAFGRLLDACVCCDTEEHVLAEIRRIDALKIKGLGPAVANILYFLHPTIAPPFNTAIVRGYNALTGANVKLGRWDEYLAMRQGLIAFNSKHRDLLSNDLGAAAAFCFDLGVGLYAPPPRTNDAVARADWAADLAKVRAQAAKPSAAEADARTHTEIQGWLRDLGRALGYDVWIAQNDRGRPCGPGRLGDHCMERLPPALDSRPGAEAVRLIDVLWLNTAGAIVAAFEVEHTTSIYSGIVRMLDLALGGDASGLHSLFLVAPDKREADVRAQIARPAFSRIADLSVRYLPYSALEQHRDAMARFGSGVAALEKVSHRLT